MKTPFLRTEWNYDTNKASMESGVKCDDETKTQQHFAEECDINVIVKRFGITGQLPQGVRAPTWGDFTDVVTDYHSAMNAIVQAQQAFDAMPADIRYRFRNDPGMFVDFCSDEANRAEAEKLGLVMPKTAPVQSPTLDQGRRQETPKVSPSPLTTSEVSGQANTTPKTGN